MSDHRRRFPDSDSHDDPHRGLLPVANILSSLLPGLGMPSPAMAGTLRTYAPWPVWRDRPGERDHRVRIAQPDQPYAAVTIPERLSAPLLFFGKPPVIFVYAGIWHRPL
jgi:hypothetical protein